jgi:DNA-binding response OmpR family regulator
MGTMDTSSAPEQNASPTEPSPVLVVDDDPELRQSLRWTLEDEGWAVETAANGEEAVTHASHRVPALVVLDVGLPDRAAPLVAAQLRERCGDDLPFLVITADGHAPEKAAQVGAFVYLHKPFDLDQLVALVHRRLDLPDES